MLTFGLYNDLELLNMFGSHGSVTCRRHEWSFTLLGLEIIFGSVGLYRHSTSPRLQRLVEGGVDPDPGAYTSITLHVASVEVWTLWLRTHCFTYFLSSGAGVWPILPKHRRTRQLTVSSIWSLSCSTSADHDVISFWVFWVTVTTIMLVGGASGNMDWKSVHQQTHTHETETTSPQQ